MYVYPPLPRRKCTLTPPTQHSSQSQLPARPQPKPTLAPANLAPRLAPTNALVQIRSGQSQLCSNPEQARAKHSARFPAGNGGHSRGKISAFSGVCPAHLDGGVGGEAGRESTACKPWLGNQKKKAHHTAPDRNIAGTRVLPTTELCPDSDAFLSPGQTHCTTCLGHCNPRYLNALPTTSPRLSTPDITSTARTPCPATSPRLQAPRNFTTLVNSR